MTRGNGGSADKSSAVQLPNALGGLDRALPKSSEGRLNGRHTTSPSPIETGDLLHPAAGCRFRNERDDVGPVQTKPSS